MARLTIVAALACAAGFGFGWLARSPAPPAPPAPLFGPAASGPVVARWRGGQLTAAQVRARVAQAAREAHLDAPSPAQRRAFAQEVLRAEVLADEALRAGLLADPRVELQVKQALARRYLERELDEALGGKLIADEELRASYAARQAEFVKPEKVHLLDLFLAAPSGSKTREARRGQAEKLRRELAAADEAQFLKRARELAGDEQAGDPGPLARDEMAQRLGAEAAAKGWLMVRLGEVSDVVAAPEGFHLLKLHARQGALDTTFEQARESLRSRLWYERRAGAMEDFWSGVSARLGYSVDPAALEQALVDAAAPSPGR